MTRDEAALLALHQGEGLAVMGEKGGNDA